MKGLDPMLPNLFIAGAAKSGTSALHEHLGRHPDICMSITKEPAYLLLDETNPKYYGNLFRKGTFRYYGESSVSYMYLPEIIQHTVKKVPNHRFIFVLRNLVDRAWSHYRWARDRYGVGSACFRDTILEDVARPLSIDNYRQLAESFYCQVGCYQAGRYAKWLSRYREIFDEHRIKVISFEDFAADTINQLNAIYDFLDLPRINEIGLVWENKTQAVTYPALVQFHGRCSKLVRMVALDFLSPPIYALLARVNYRLANFLNKGAQATETRILSRADRAWIASHYMDDVAQLREMTGMPFRQWSGDFPAATDKFAQTGALQ